MKILLLILITLLPCEALSQIIKNPTDNAQCAADTATKYMLWREARNQPLDVQILVLRVLENRVRKFKSSVCAELFRKGAYPYMKNGVKSIPRSFTQHYNKVRKSKKFINTKYLYFNHVPHKFGRNTKKIGGLFFTEE